MASVFSLSGFLKHLLRMEVHLLTFRSTVLSSTASVFLEHDVTLVSGRTLLDFA